MDVPERGEHWRTEVWRGVFAAVYLALRRLPKTNA